MSIRAVAIDAHAPFVPAPLMSGRREIGLWARDAFERGQSAARNYLRTLLPRRPVVNAPRRPWVPTFGMESLLSMAGAGGPFIGMFLAAEILEGMRSTPDMSAVIFYASSAIVISGSMLALGIELAFSDHERECSSTGKTVTAAYRDAHLARLRQLGASPFARCFIEREDIDRIAAVVRDINARHP